MRGLLGSQTVALPFQDFDLLFDLLVSDCQLVAVSAQEGVQIEEGLGPLLKSLKLFDLALLGDSRLRRLFGRCSTI